MATAQVEVLKPRQIVAYDPFRAQLAELKELNDSVVFNLETKKGMKDAKSHIYKLKQTKSGLEKVRKLEKQESLDRGRLIDSEARDIAGQVDEMIEVQKAPIDEIEQLEKDRIAKHRLAIDCTNDICPIDTVEDINKFIKIVSDIVIDDSLEEFFDEMKEAKEKKLAQLNDALAFREKADADAAELERLRLLEKAKADKEREEQIKKDAVETERKRVKTSKKQTQNEFVTRETELVADTERAQREKAEAEERAANAEIVAKQKAEQEVLDAKKVEKEAAAEREADVKHHKKINNEAMLGFIKGGLNITQAKLAVTLIAQKKVPNVAINY